MFQKEDHAVSGVSGLLGGLLKEPKYSDLEIQCGDKVFKLHRLVVCLQSKPLAAFVDSGFLESMTGVIKLVDDDPQIVDLFIQFMYKGTYKYEIPCGTLNSNPHLYYSAPLTHAKVYGLAEKYDVSALKTLACKKYIESLSVTSEEDIVGFASFSESLKEIFNSTPDTNNCITDAALSYAQRHFKELMDVGEFYTLCKENGEISTSIMRNVAHEMIKGRECEAPKCRKCGDNLDVRTSTIREREKHATSCVYFCCHCKVNFDFKE